MVRRLAARVSFLAGVALLVVAAVHVGADHGAPAEPVPAALPHAPAAAPHASPRAEGEEAACQDDALVVPSGHPVGLSCAQARSLLGEIRTRFAEDLPTPAPGAFAE